MMNIYLWITVVPLAFFIGAQLWVSLQLATLRRAGEYPKRGKAVMADVHRLLKNGNRVLAMRCYREIHLCSLRQAKQALEMLSASP